MKYDDEEKGAEDVAMEEGESVSGRIPTEDIAAIRARMEHRDSLRERLIKTCRDGQKAAKQAIFGKLSLSPSIFLSA